MDSGTTQDFSSQLASHRALRESLAKKRQQGLNELKDKGNAAFHAGDYKKAIRLYASAIVKYGFKANLCSNLATALSKLELWSDVEWAATLALKAVPTAIKPRFRRAMARKTLKRLRAARLDLETILELDPSCVEAADELDIIPDEPNAGPATSTENDSAWPEPDLVPYEYDSDSDTEDSTHKGSGAPCRLYNNNKCERGGQCPYSHAPDDQSVRDELGRNVCILHLFDSCKLGARKCPYSHDTRYLPHREWWESLQAAAWCSRLHASMQEASFDVANFGAVFHSVPATRILAKSKLQALDMAGLRRALSNADKVVVPAVGPSTAPAAADLSKDILLISFEAEDWFDDMYAHLLEAISQKRRIIRALDPRQALEHLSSPVLDGVIVTDAVISRKPSAVVGKLVNYVKNGGIAVIGAQFSGGVTPPNFQKFFKHFGLAWKSGAYQRAKLFLNPNNAVAIANPSLSQTIDVKALYADGITSDMAVYTTKQLAPRQSQTVKESPVVIAGVGNGYLAYVGDVNAEEVSTNVYLALLRLLDVPVAVEPEPPLSSLVPEPQVKANSTRPSTSSQKKAKAQPPSQESSVPGLPVFVLLLEGKDLFMKSHSRQLAALKKKTKVEIVTNAASIKGKLNLLSTRRVYVADAAVANSNHFPLLGILRDYVWSGGCVVFGGLFPLLVTAPRAKTIFSAFKQQWTLSPTGSTTKTKYDILPTSETAKANRSLPRVYNMRAQNLTNITDDLPVYQRPPASADDLDDDELEAPVVRGQFGHGYVAYLGDVDDEDSTSPVLLALFGLLDPPKPAASLAKRRSRKFVMFMAPDDLDNQKDLNDGLLEHLSSKLDVISDLPIARMTDLMVSQDLVGVFIATTFITKADEGYLLNKLVEYTNNGGTVIFLNDFAKGVSTAECLPFFMDAWGLQWGLVDSTYAGIDASPNPSSLLFTERRKKHKLPTNPDMEDSFVLYSSDLRHVPYVPETGVPEFWTRTKVYRGPVLYASVGSGGGHVGFLGWVGDDFEMADLAFAMINVDVTDALVRLGILFSFLCED